ncbi:hypothetical protein NliqN6_2663 [Naganishia liquefaciens]|uniref:Squalene synthase n=1 Tax=Naganishia liquefaciens TaxID=104408 RepID=A0A8H3YG01_9TREE|nr:hypothetical protein NliqN6_2663 [Naganishia liquefaciens]
MGILDYVLLAFTHPTEFRALASYSVWHDPKRDITDPKEHVTSGWDREAMRECWGWLDKTSRSFSMVIKELDGDLARVVCIFYLVLRGLDTVEDDMTIPNSIKLPLLKDFYNKLDEPGWNFDGNGPNEKDRGLMVRFQVVIEEFQRLDKSYQEVIRSVCQKMGHGMAQYAALATPEAPVAEVNSIEDYDLYCHYVAGLVGEGLSGLFSASGKERSFIKDQLTLSNHMGLLLQKTNILRDFREDVDEGRGFWPRAIWGKYGFDKMGDLRDESREKEALWALSEMTLDALRHATPALDYLSLLKCQSVFNFVAIPAVMALATLERCFMNPDVLKKNVKIRKGEAIKLMNVAVNPRDVAYCFVSYAKKIHAKVSVHDPNFVKLSIACGKIEQWAEHHYPSFVIISAASGGGASSSVNVEGGDARARLYAQIVEQEKAKAAQRRKDEILENLRSKGLLKPRYAPDGTEITYTEAEKAIIAAQQPNQGIPIKMIIGITGMLLLVFGITAAFLVIGVKYYAVPSLHVPEE